MVESNGDIERVTTVSEIVAVDERNGTIAPVAPPPNIANLNVNKSSKVHIGTKIVSVTQNVHNPELVKGRCLCLDLVAPIGPRGMRCGVAVFVCWAIVVAIALILYMVFIVLPSQKIRLDIDLPLRLYLWDVVKNSSKAERLCCAVAVIVVIVCVTLIIYFTTKSARAAADTYDVAPHEWNIKSEMWLAAPYLNHTPIAINMSPVMLVVVQHTVGPECHRFVICAAEFRNLQLWFQKTLEYDIPYNFMIGNDGRVYEGRGWNIEGAHTFGYNRCSVGLGFTGDYREEIPGHASATEQQMNRTLMILEEGVRLGYLRPDYLIVGARDLRDTASPGSNLYAALQKLPHFDHQNRFHGLTCEMMQEKFGNQTLYPGPIPTVPTKK